MELGPWQFKRCINGINEEMETEVVKFAGDTKLLRLDFYFLFK